MKALLLEEYRRLILSEMPMPEVGENDVLIQVAACGICGSDVHGYDGRSGRRIPPIVMGHEAAGHVAGVGAQVSNVQVGDRVTFDSMVSCGTCRYCQSGRSNLCADRRGVGVSCSDYRCHGAFAEYIAVPQHIVYPLPAELPLEHAALVEPLAVALHAVDRANLTPRSTAMVVGSGVIGLLVIQVLRHKGCGPIITVDLEPSRLDLARQLGADHCLPPDPERLREVLNAETAGEGVDCGFEAVGATQPVQLAIESTRQGGRVVLIGNLTPQVDMPLQSVVIRELDLFGSCASSGEYPGCIEMLASGAIDVEPMISQIAPLTEGPEWFDRLYDQAPNLIKVILRPNDSS